MSPLSELKAFEICQLENRLPCGFSSLAPICLGKQGQLPFWVFKGLPGLLSSSLCKPFWWSTDVLTPQQRIHLVKKLLCTSTVLSIALLHVEYSKEIYHKLSNL